MTMNPQNAMAALTGESGIQKQQIGQFGRAFALMFNRLFMYQASHPAVLESIDAVYRTLEDPLRQSSPIAFLLNREKIYIDDEPLDPRINVQRLIRFFKKTGIESISLFEGADRQDLRRLIEITGTPEIHPTAESMKKAMFRKGVHNIRINHVFFKKVTEDEEIVSRDILESGASPFGEGSREQAREMFFGKAVESVLMEEFAGAGELGGVLLDPAAFAGKLIMAESRQANGGAEGEVPRGRIIMEGLASVDREVARRLSAGEERDPAGMVDALRCMRRELLKGIEAHRMLGVRYADEEGIVEKVTGIGDRVILQLVREEYAGGGASVERMRRILLRLIPDPADLKRLFPEIRDVLIAEGMPAGDFMDLAERLGDALQGEGLAGMLKEESEKIGIEGGELMARFRQDPRRAAELVYLASEIRDAGGNEGELARLLVDYVERVGSEMSGDIEDPREKRQLRQAIAAMKPRLAEHLGGGALTDDLVRRLEDKINRRIDAIVEEMRKEWLQHPAPPAPARGAKPPSVFEAIRQSVNVESELGEILDRIRSRIEAGDIDENDFEQIYGEIVNLERTRKDQRARKGLTAGVVSKEILMTFLEKEMAISLRYDTPFAVLGFTLVKAKLKRKGRKVSYGDVIDVFLHELAIIFRSSDVVGELQTNRYMAVLPMTNREEGTLALRRAMRLLHEKPLEVEGNAFSIRVAGVVAAHDARDCPQAGDYVDHLLGQLGDMATRINNLHLLS